MGDDVRLFCAPTGAGAAGSTWTTHFSEENTSYRYCPPLHWMAGIACKGGWCDDVSIQCTYYPNVNPRDCYWTGWIAEENGGTLQFGPGFYARGAQCSGSRCDNMRFYVCRM